MATSDFAPEFSASSNPTDDGNLRDTVLRAPSVNPAVQRLQRRLRAQADASEVITSYDRMHHRHNRS
jgi:hypothetical protein